MKAFSVQTIILENPIQIQAHECMRVELIDDQTAMVTIGDETTGISRSYRENIQVLGWEGA